MTCRRSFALLLALVLAGCGGEGQRGASSDWRATLARGDGAGAAAAMRRELAGGARRTTLAPFLGEAALLQGDLKDAHGWLDQAQFAPDVAAHGYRMLGRLRMREGDLPGAGQAFDRALSLAPEDPELWVDIGRLRWRGGEHAQSVEASKKALALGPGDPAALLFRGQQVRDAQGNAAAIPLLERGLAASPADTDLLAEYAATLGELGRAREMLAAVRKLPVGPRAYYLQAVLAARAGRYDLARGLLERSADLDREMPTAILLLAIIDLENGNAESAAQGFDKLLRRQPDNRRVRLLLARALATGGNHRELIARFSDEADNAYLSLLVARAYEAINAREKAAPYLDRVVTTPTARVVPLRAAIALDVARARGAAVGTNAVGLVRGLLASGRTGEGRAMAKAFLDAHPGSADAMALAGDAALASRDYAGALKFYRRAAAIRRPWPLTKRMVAALDLLGRATEGTALIAMQSEAEPGNAEARDWLRRRSTS